MKSQTTPATAFSKAIYFYLIIGTVLLLSLSHQLQAQNNTSYNANTIPITGSNNSAFGQGTLFNNTSGYNNTATGYRALYSNTTGYDNVATGYQSLYSNTTGGGNTASGYQPLYFNTTGYGNVATGYQSLYSNTTGSFNIATGFQALYSNSIGKYNIAIGTKALYSNIETMNIAIGDLSLYNNISGSYNIVTGYQAMYLSTAGHSNIATGFQTLFSNTTGGSNCATGILALYSNTTGNYNTAIGNSANVASGTLSNTTVLGYNAIVNTSNKIRFGNASVTVVEGPVSYTVSDNRFKTNIKEEVKGLEFIKKLRPVVYNFDTKKLTEFWTKNMPDSIRQKHLDKDFTASTAIRQSGFIAQEVEKAAKEANYDFNGLHTPADDNDNYSLSYGQFVVPLVKAMQEQQKMIEDQQQSIEALQQQINELKKNNRSSSATNNSPQALAGASLEQNIPNPFSGETVIQFNLPQQVSKAYMTVYDMTGREIKTILINKRGSASITFSADRLAAGMYIYSITADGKMVDAKRMVVAGK